MNSFDLSIFNILHVAAGKWFLLDWTAILFAKWIPYLLIPLFLVFVIKEKDKKKKAYAFAWAALAMIVSRGIITQVIYYFYQRPRPFVALGIEPVFNHAALPSFPSSHMTVYAVLIAPMWYLKRKWGMIYAVLVAIMAIGRVYGAVHWPSDVIAGLVIAGAASYGVKYVLFKENLHKSIK